MKVGGLLTLISNEEGKIFLMKIRKEKTNKEVNLFNLLLIITMDPILRRQEEEEEKYKLILLMLLRIAHLFSPAQPYINPMNPLPQKRRRKGTNSAHFILI